MTKKLNLALNTLFITVLFSLFSISVFAQKSESVKTEQSQQCSGETFIMPLAITVGNKAFEDFIKVGALPRGERGQAFRALSNEQKASFIKVNLALQFVKRPNMTKDQQEFVLDAISKVSGDLYDKSDPVKIKQSEESGREIENRALGLFAYKDLGDFIEPLMTDKTEEVALLRKYEDLLKNGMKARKKLVKEMPVNDRVNIWKTQLVYHLTTANLLKPQRDLIVEFLMTLSVAKFINSANQTKEESAKALEILDRKIQSVFSKAEEFAIFEALGIQKIITDTGETSASLDGPYKFCNCRWYCGTSQSCDNDCNVQVAECGPFDDSYCTGRCQ